MAPILLVALLTLLLSATTSAELASVKPFISTEPWLGKNFKDGARVPLIVEQCETTCACPAGVALPDDIVGSSACCVWSAQVLSFTDLPDRGCVVDVTFKEATPQRLAVSSHATCRCL